MSIFLKDYPKEQVNAVILDINKALDKEITLIINDYKEYHNLKLNSLQRSTLRHYIYYSVINKVTDLDDYQFKINNDFENYVKSKISKDFIDSKLEESKEYLNNRIETSERERTNILGSITTRLNNLNNSSTDKSEDFKKYIEKEESYLKHLSIYNFKPSGSDQNDFSNIKKFLNEIYDDLVNYQFAIVMFENSEQYQYSWSTIAKSAIYAENFKTSDDFPPFRKRKSIQIETVTEFLLNNPNLDIDKDNSNEVEHIVEKFYDEQSYGFLFSDLFIANDMSQKALILQKVEYDSTEVPCPDCMDFNPRGNSYSKVMFKSFECSNPTCKSRSKSGRGKRYSYYSAKLQNKQIYANSHDDIPDHVYTNYRRDIIDSTDNLIFDLISLYSFSNDNVVIYTDKQIPNTYRTRSLKTRNNLKANNILNDESLKISSFLREIKPYINNKKKDILLNDDEQVILENNDSSAYLDQLKPGQYSYAITSPPYYNAREYSQWPNMLCYLVDMMVNINNVFNSIDDDGIYLYNIGDIVDQDNVYIPSLMSKRRQIVGLYSVLLFETMVGWHTSGNIIWDKGEVQSKRNSTSDLLPYYVKPINCYEHIWIFTKKRKKEEYSKVEKFSPVIKMHANGKNSAKHTAPYPLELVDLIDPFIKNKNERILDPYLGSGTTALWCLRNNQRCLGIELNEEYYQVSLERLNKDYYNITLF